MFNRQFPLIASTLGAMILFSGCGTGYPGGFGYPDGLGPVPDFGEMGPPAYREQPPSSPPDVTLLPPPASQPNTPQDPGSSPIYPSPAPSPEPTPTPTPTPPPANDSEFLGSLENAILQRVNEERAKVGAKALVMETKRREVARNHSKDMAVRNFFDHNNPDGKSPFDRMRAVGISFRTAGENIAYNTYPVDRAADAAMDGWMKSDGHRKNILNTGYGRIGIGVYRKPSNGRVYFTQVFTD